MGIAKGYQGNPNLRPAGIPQEWTPEQREEWEKCYSDPIYFIEQYMVVKSKGKRTKIKLYPWQKRIIRDYQNHTSTIVVTARQAGKSTTTVGFIMWFILFHSTKTCAIVANKEMVAFEMISRIKYAYKDIPLWLQQGVVKWDKGRIDLENDSIVFGAATSPDSISGFTVDFLMVDEAAKIENWAMFWPSTSQTLTSNPDAKIAMISTPLGMNHFYQFWQNSDRADPLKYRRDRDSFNEFHGHLITWKSVPGRDEKWRKKTLALLGFDEDKFAQEQEGEFIGSSGTLIAGWKLKELAEDVRTPAVFTAGVKQYEAVIPKHKYVIVADVSEGKGLDYSAAQIIDITALPYRQVATYHDNGVTPHEYAMILAKLGRHFNLADILVENNNAGAMVTNALWEDFEYEHLIFTKPGKKGRGARAGWDVAVGPTNGAEAGIKTTVSTKTAGCMLLKHLIEQNKFKLVDSQTITELHTFARRMKADGTYMNVYEAEKGHHDDLVMGLVLAAWLFETDSFKHVINTLAALKDKGESLVDELAPFMFHSTGHDDHWDDVRSLMMMKPEEEEKQKVWKWPSAWQPAGGHLTPEEREKALAAIRQKMTKEQRQKLFPFEGS